MGCNVFMIGSGGAERLRLQLVQKQPAPAELQRGQGSVWFAQGLFTLSGPRQSNGGSCIFLVPGHCQQFLKEPEFFTRGCGLETKLGWAVGGCVHAYWAVTAPGPPKMHRASKHVSSPREFTVTISVLAKNTEYLFSFPHSILVYLPHSEHPGSL